PSEVAWAWAKVWETACPVAACSGVEKEPPKLDGAAADPKPADAFMVPPPSDWPEVAAEPPPPPPEPPAVSGVFEEKGGGWGAASDGPGKGCCRGFPPKGVQLNPLKKTLVGPASPAETGLTLSRLSPAGSVLFDAATASPSRAEEPDPP